MRNKKKILVIEDEEVIQSLCRRLLARMGYASVIVGGLKAAMQEIEKSNDIDMLITDMRLPDGNSMDAIQKVCQKHPKTKILMITGSVTIPEDRMTQLKDMGLTEKNVLFKPFEMKEFESIIDRCLGER